MKQAAFISFLLLPALCFPQILERKTDLSGQTGIQLGEIYASGKGSRPNEAYYLNTLLYYRTRYIINNDEILGSLSGRITKEEPLSSLTFFQLESIRNPQASYSNLLKSYPEYYNALGNYDLFIRLFQDSLKKAAAPAEKTGAEYEGYGGYGGYGEYLPEDYLPAAPPAEAETNSMPNDGALSLHKIPQRGVFQKAEGAFAVPAAAEPFPPLEEVLKDSTKTLSAKELEFLIRYEELTRAYSNTVIEYQKVLAARRLLDAKPLFDPADPNESFRILVSGEDDPGLIWIKDFTLDGEKNYQSYDKDLWFLRYEFPLTKKDVRLLSNIYLKSKSVAFQVIGKGGTAQITLSGEQVSAFKKLFEDYIFGKMVLPEMETELSPLLR